MEEQTKLSDIPLPYMDTVLAERFLLPPDSMRRFGMVLPTTIGELSAASGMNVPEVIKAFNEVIALNHQIWIEVTPTQKLKDCVDWIIDMRPGLDMDAEPLHPDARIFHHGNQAAQLQMMRTFSKVLVLSSPQEHAWSAAISLRQMGVKAVLIKII